MMNSEVSQHGAEGWKKQKRVDQIAGDADMFDVPDSSDYEPMGVGNKTPLIILTRNSASERDLAEIEANLQAGNKAMDKLRHDEYNATQRRFDATKDKK